MLEASVTKQQLILHLVSDAIIHNKIISFVFTTHNVVLRKVALQLLHFGYLPISIR